MTSRETAALPAITINSVRSDTGLVVARAKRGPSLECDAFLFYSSDLKSRSSVDRTNPPISERFKLTVLDKSEADPCPVTLPHGEDHPRAYRSSFRMPSSHWSFSRDISIVVLALVMSVTCLRPLVSFHTNHESRVPNRASPLG